MDLVPPYLNKMELSAKKELHKAEKNELRAKKDYEFAQEYAKLCKDRVDKISKEKQNV